MMATAMAMASMCGLAARTRDFLAYDRLTISISNEEDLRHEGEEFVRSSCYVQGSSCGPCWVQPRPGRWGNAGGGCKRYHVNLGI